MPLGGMRGYLDARVFTVFTDGRAMNLPFMNNRSFASRLWPLVGFPSKLVRQGGKEILVRLLRKIAFLCYWNGDYSYAEMAYDAILRLRPRDAFSTAMRV